jgi:hypothetical protein
MATGNDLIERINRNLYSGIRVARNILVTPYTAAGTTLTMTYSLKGIRSGVYLSIDLEIFYVLAINEPTKTATVVGAQLGSVAADHAASATVEINPQFPRFSVFESLNDELADISSPMYGLFQIKTADLTFNPAFEGFDLAGVTDIIDILEVRYTAVDGRKRSPEIRDFELVREAPVGTFPSGFGLVIQSYADPGQNIRIKYRAPFTSVTSATVANDVVTTTGMTASMLDIPVLGACGRLIAGREVKRNLIEAQGSTRRSAEVPAGSQLQSAQAFVRLRNDRIKAEAARLYAQYPQSWR